MWRAVTKPPAPPDVKPAGVQHLLLSHSAHTVRIPCHKAPCARSPPRESVLAQKMRKCLLPAKDVCAGSVDIGNRQKRTNVRYKFRLKKLNKPLSAKGHRGAVFIEYLLLVTLVGFGVIVGLAALRGALVNELLDLANAINAINT